MRQRKKDTVMKFFAVFTIKFLHLKLKLGGSKIKNNVIRTLFRRNSCECESSSPCESPNISERNEERCDTCLSTTSNPIKSDNESQFTKLAGQKSRVKDIHVDSVIKA